MAELRVAHTADLSRAELDGARALLDAVFTDEVTDDDWWHCLGGVHALVVEDGAPVAHGAVVQRRLIHAGRVVRTGYVEGVGVSPDRRRRGHGAAVMAALERVIRGAYELGALAATDDGKPFYAARTWQLWRGPSSALTPEGIRPTPGEDGGIFVLPVSGEVDLDGELTADWREGDVW